MAPAAAPDSTPNVAATAAPTLATLVSFNVDNGTKPCAGLIADAGGGPLRHDKEWRRGVWLRVRDRQDRQRFPPMRQSGAAA